METLLCKAVYNYVYFFCTNVPKQVNISYAKFMDLYQVHFICIFRRHQFDLCSNGEEQKLQF